MAKNEKRVRMTLYKMHDYDLVKYYMSLRDKDLKNPKIAFYSVVKNLLIAYSGGAEFTAPRIKTYSEETMPSKVNVRFTLDPSTDKAAIELIENIKDRQLNSFLKSLVRRNLEEDGLRCYYLKDYEPTSELGKKKEKAKKERDKKTYEKAVKTLTGKDLKTMPAPVSEPEISESAESAFDFFGAIGNINK